MQRVIEFRVTVECGDCPPITMKEYGDQLIDCLFAVNRSRMSMHAPLITVVAHKVLDLETSSSDR